MGPDESALHCASCGFPRFARALAEPAYTLSPALELGHDVVVFREAAASITRGLVDTVDWLEAWRRGAENTPGRSVRDVDRVFVTGLVHPLLTAYEEAVVGLVDAIAAEYAARFSTRLGLSWCSGLELLRYRQGQSYPEHVDVGPRDPVAARRQVSLVVYLEGEYSGGGLHFPRQGLLVTPGPGDVVVFPSAFTHPHAALPVESGIKHAVVSWLF